jgi:uncharacterized protein DUF3263
MIDHRSSCISARSPQVLEPSAAVVSLAPVSRSSTGSETAEVAALDQRDRELLDFEREAWKLRMSKERAIRERFGFSAARYHQLLNRAIDRPEAIAYDPMLVRRLRRIRDARRRKRTAGRLGIPL